MNNDFISNASQSKGYRGCFNELWSGAYYTDNFN